jgi:hypothetical protein
MVLGTPVVTLTLFWVLAGTLCERPFLDAEVGSDLRTIRGTLVCEAGGAEVDLATYPAVLRDPTGLDDVNRDWFYPAGFEAARMRLAVDGGEPTSAVEAWTRVRGRHGRPLRVEFETHVPQRNGTFGRHRGVAFLLGGWHPSPGAIGDLRPSRYRFRIRVPAEVVGFVGNRPFGATSGRVIEGEFVGRFVPMLLAPALEVSRRGDTVVLVPRSAPRGGRTGLRDISASLDRRALDELHATLEQGAELAGRVGLGGDPSLVVQVPLREHLVERFDGGLAVSDRAFHLLPYERFLKFHRLSVWREQLAALALPHCRRTEVGLPPDLVADLVGAALRDRLGAERYGGREYAPDILDTFAIIPEIDSLIFAPQISFVDSYFAAIDETPRRRWRLDDFFHDRPRGKLLYEKMYDLLGSAGAQELVTAYLAGHAPLRQVAERSGAGLTIDPWLGPHPRLDYTIGEVRRDGDELIVEVEAHGPDANRVEEPVTVEVQSGDEVRRSERLGPGPVHLPTIGEPDRVEIDPDGRLVELHHDEGEAPRFNNRDPKRWRFLLNNIAGLIAVTNKELSVAADFSLRRIHDLRYRLDLFALYTPSSTGAAVTGSYAFGREITPLRLAHRFGLSFAYERLRSEGGTVVSGDQASARLVYRYDDRLSPYWSYEGRGLSLRLTGAVGRTVVGDWYEFLQPGISGFYIWQLAFGHALVGRLRADANLGEAPLQDALSVGDLYRAGRGYERDEARGDTRVVASVEYRHLFVGDARTDVGGLVTWTRLEGALFADAIYLSAVDPESCNPGGFFDVGYGLRFIGDVLGVTPAEITIDIGIPLNRCDVASDRPPVAVYIGFLQSFSSF